MKRIFLIGYMGAGKTTLGKIVAQKAGLEFIDLDTFIESRLRMSVSDIFQQKGESGFREIERVALHEVGDFEDVIIATGGGVPCFFDNAEFMNSVGTTIYLKTSIDTLFERLKIGKQSRPILKDKSDDELREFIKITLQRREIHYMKANTLFDANKLDNRQQINEAAEKLINMIEGNTDNL